MLDNFTLQQIRETIAALKKTKLREKVLVEASGGINRQNVVDYAATGVDIISLGELTDSAKALDMSLEITKAKEK